MAARKAVLEQLGYEIHTAGDAEAALAEADAVTFQLVITDYRMPAINGVELIARLREKYPNLPVILLSGFADALGLDENNTGADVVLQKSYNEVNLMVRSVSRLLQKKPPKKPPSAQSKPPSSRRRIK